MCEHTFYLVPACDQYEENSDGTFTLKEQDSSDSDAVLTKAIPLKITGIVRPSADADTTDIQTAVGYTSKLTDYLISYTDESAVVTAQEEIGRAHV